MRLRRAVALPPEEIRARAKRLLMGLGLAGAVLGLLFGSLAAYAGMWPPVLVVESGSMQHSDTESEIGVLDTGDLAIIQAVHSPADIVTYLGGRASGYASFGDYGDVIAFADPEPNESAVLVHRAFAYVSRNASGGFDVPELVPLPRTQWWGTAVDESNASVPRGLRSFSVVGMGWRHDLTIAWDLAILGANYSNDGLLTFGDHNLYQPTKRTDPWILPAAYVLARARGEIPWLGLIRLTFARSPEGCCAGWGSTDPTLGAPGNSWLSLDVLLVAAFGGPVAADLALRRGLLPWIRRSRGRESRDEPSESPPEGVDLELAGVPGGPPPPGEFSAWLQTIDDRIQRIRASGGQR